MSFENKLVAVLNKSLEPGVAMNALSHMSLGLGAKLGVETLHLDTYVDQDGLPYPNISQMPFIVLKGSGNKIKSLVESAREKDIQHGAFLDTMTGGTYIEQLEKTKAKTAEELVFYGAILFGPFEIVKDLTKKFSLWK